MSVPFEVLGRKYGPNDQPYVIAEIGVNHEGDFATACRLIELAKEGGADAAKFQTYKAGKIASKNSPYYWDLQCEPTRSQYELFQKYDSFGPEEYARLAEHCKKVGIDYMSTPFDDEAIDFLDPLMKIYKVASADLTNIPLLKRVASKKKPVLLSTGASTLEEVRWAVRFLEEQGVKHLTLLHCILNYPCEYQNANLGMILDLQKQFPNLHIGYSDHTRPGPNMEVPLLAVAMGARVLEKHFTHDKSLPGNDHYHAMDVADMKRFRERVAFYLSALGSCEKKALASEEPARANARRSIVAKSAIKKGEVLTESNITYKRPGTGIPIREWNGVLGKKAAHSIEEDHVLQWSDLEK